MRVCACICEYTHVYVCRPGVSLWCPSSRDIHLVVLDRVSMLSWRSPIKQVVWLLSPRDLPVYLPGLGLCVCVVVMVVVVVLRQVLTV